MEGYVWEVERVSPQDFDVEVYEEDGEVEIRGNIELAVKVGDVIRNITVYVRETRNLRHWEDEE